MLRTDWSSIKYFTPNEAWGNYQLIAYRLVKELDNYREEVNTPIFISCGVQGTHAKNSYHYPVIDPVTRNVDREGWAVDILFPEKEKWEIPQLLIHALKFNFGGIGAYESWHLNGVERGGLHLDIRPCPPKKLWIGLANGSYLPLSFDLLNQLFKK